MLIEGGLLRFCAEKTIGIVDEYDKACGVGPGYDGFPRSADDLDWILQGRTGKPIFHRLLPVRYDQAKYRSFYVLFPDKFTIYYARDLAGPHLRYYKTKELMQIALEHEGLRTKDIVEFVRNMMIRGSPDSFELNLGHAATSDTLADIAAMEYLFPWSHRLNYVDIVFNGDGNGISEIAERYDIPAFVVQRAFNVMMPLEQFFKKAGADAA